MQHALQRWEGTTEGSLDPCGSEQDTSAGCVEWLSDCELNRDSAPPLATLNPHALPLRQRQIRVFLPNKCYTCESA
jgi:hypothetical protein